VLGLSDAIHEETSVGSIALISKLSCSLKGQEEQIVVQRKASWLYQVLQVENIVAKYYCSYGVNRSFYNLLNRDPLMFTAFSKDGEVRAFELRGHRFFNGTLFQPSLDSYVNRPNPLLLSFMKLCA
jgi:CTP synthase (UTP-ammonia lyase)